MRPRDSGGSPRPRITIVSPGCVPAGISSGTSPSSVGTCTVVPSAASGAGTSITVTRSSPSRRKRSSSAHPHDHVEVARGPAVLARVPAARQPDPLAVGDPGRDVDRHAALLGHHARAVALRSTASPGSGRRPPHTSHTAVRTSWPNAVRATRWCWPVPSQRRAGDDRRARLGAVAAAARAHRRRLVGDLDRLAVRGLGEVDRRGRDHVGALHRAAAPAPAASRRRRTTSNPPPPRRTPRTGRRPSRTRPCPARSRARAARPPRRSRTDAAAPGRSAPRRPPPPP